MTSSDDWELIQDLYLEGLGLDDTARTRLLERRCPNRPDLHQKLHSLWRHAPKQDRDSLDQVRNMATSLFGRIPAQPLPSLDRYTILGRLGSGGTGVVYRAEQHKPSRLVALKVLSLGNCSADRLRRFRDEQQALALIDHPNVAKVYDCGETREGQPFYSMEFLNDTPLTRWCDEQRLSLDQRLTMFKGICEGLAQAHGKGIIHRDIKPANILVAETANGPMPRLIDFGIAKFRENGHQTVTGAILGTPGYMSPEQATGAGEAVVDVRSDIYNLGAVLYELVSGQPPLGKAMEGTRSLEEVFRLTREIRPDPPNYHLKADTPQAREIAQNRRANLSHLRKKLGGELGWIIMKALAYRQRDRYASCEALVRDLDRYREGLPLEAVPTRRFYRARKLARYYRRPLLLGSLFLALLLAAILFISLALIRARRAEGEARDHLRDLEATLDFTQGIFADVDPARAGRDVTGVELLQRAETDLPQRFADRPELEASNRMVLGNAWHGLGIHARARDQFQRAYGLYRDLYGENAEPTLRAKTALAFLLSKMGDPLLARDFFRSALDTCRYLSGPDHPETLSTASGLAHVLGQLGETGPALDLFRGTLHAQERILGPQAQPTKATRLNFANLLILTGDLRSAAPLVHQLYEDPDLVSNPDHPSVLRARQLLALYLEKTGDREGAAVLYFEILEERERVLGSYHPDTLLTRNNLAVTLGDTGQTEDALTLLWEVLTDREFAQTEHPVTLRLRHNLGHFLMESGKGREAEDILECVLADRAKALGPHHADSLRTRWTLAEAIDAQGRSAEADSLYREVAELAERHLGSGHRDTRLYQRLLGEE